MYQYNIIQWVFFFYTYCFIGWCFETIYVSIRSKKVINRGFMRGPFLPIYGSGAIVMLIVSAPFQENVLLTYFAGVIGATSLEYVTGYCMEALFKVRYWDYSNQKYNYKGYICLTSSIAWGFFTILMTRVIHKPIEKMVLNIPYQVLNSVTIFLTIIVIIDFTVAFKTALDLRDILLRMEKGREEIARIQKRLDVLIAIIDEGKEELSEKYLIGVKEEISELREKFKKHSCPEPLMTAKDFLKRNLIQANPSMHSRRYNGLLNEIKEEIEKMRKK